MEAEEADGGGGGGGGATLSLSHGSDEIRFWTPLYELLLQHCHLLETVLSDQSCHFKKL